MCSTNLIIHMYLDKKKHLIFLGSQYYNNNDYILLLRTPKYPSTITRLLLFGKYWKTTILLYDNLSYYYIEETRLRGEIKIAGRITKSFFSKPYSISKKQ